MLLSLYILREHIAPFFYSLGIITFLFVIDFLMKLLELVFSKGLDIFVILEIFVLNIAWMLALSIPMSCLVASLMAFGRMAGDNEIIAIKSGGISPLRIFLPAMLMAILICLGLVYFNNKILPEANHRAASLKSDISRKNAPAFITPGTLIKDFPNYRIWVDSIDYKVGRLLGVKIYGWEKRQPPRYMYSKEAALEYTQDEKKLLIHLFNGENHIVDTKDPSRYIRLQFKTQTVAIENVESDLVRRDRQSRSDREMSVDAMYEIVERSHQQIDRYKQEYPEKIFSGYLLMDSLLGTDTLSHIPPRLLEDDWWKTTSVSTVYYRRLKGMEKEKLYQINKYERSVGIEQKQISKYLVEVHKKFSIPVACIVFVLAGGALGILAKRGSIGVGAIISSIFILIYWVCLLGGETLADKLIINPIVAMWAPNVIVGLIGIVLMGRVLFLRRLI